MSANYGDYEIQNAHRYNYSSYPFSVDVNLLFRRYDFKVVETKMRYVSQNQPPWKINDAGRLVDMPISKKEVVVLEIDVQNFEKLSSHYTDLIDYADRLDRIKYKLNQEEKLRSKFPAVAKAYENYQMMLALMGHSKEKTK